MSIFTIPSWIKPHLYTGKDFKDLSPQEISELKERLSHFSHPDPEISIVIPAWNEENNIYRTLSSLASSNTKTKVEILVINNNSSDGTQQVLDTLGVKSHFELEQGITFARQKGLVSAKGKYHLCADSDTFYPPSWVDLMIKPMRENPKIVGVYGRYSFLPEDGSGGRFIFSIYENIAGLLIRLRKYKREHINVLGFNMGFITRVGINNGGFKVTEVRKFDNAAGSDYFVEESEDGRMALNLKKEGKLKLVTHPKARVFTSSRRLVAEGGIVKSFMNRLKLHSKKITEYVAGPSADNF